MSRRRVFVRGVGACSALGETWEETAAALAAGHSAIAPIRRFDAHGFPCVVAAEIGEVAPDGPGDRRVQLGRRAAWAAWAQAAIDAPPERIGVFVGAESGRTSWQTLAALGRAAGDGGAFDHRRFAAAAPAFADELGPELLSPAAVASALASLVGARGPVETISLACASSSAAIGEAARAIRLGVCDVALCGGVGADVDPLMLAGFSLLGVLSTEGMSRPFDRRRDGFVLGEGAAMLVLSSARGEASVELLGIGRTLDACSLTAPDPDGDGAARAIAAALADAGITAVDYVQAHGPSTLLGDPAEIAALCRVLGPACGGAHVSSVKGALGHWIAGAGALGFLCAAHAVATGTMLPTANLNEPEPACAAAHIRGPALRKDVRSALVNAFAFGGANSCLVVGRAR